MCVLVCFCVCVLVVSTNQRTNEPTNQRTNEPTNQRTNEPKKTLLISLFICRGGTPYGTLGFIPQLSSVMLVSFFTSIITIKRLKIQQKIKSK